MQLEQQLKVQLQQQQALSARGSAVPAPRVVAATTMGKVLALAHADPSHCSLVISPMITRARKKQKVASPASPVEYAIFEQVDVIGSSPPLSRSPSSPQASVPSMGSPPSAVGLPPAPNLLSSGSPLVPTPSSQHLAQSGAGLHTPPPAVIAVGLPLAPAAQSAELWFTFGDNSNLTTSSTKQG